MNSSIARNINIYYIIPKVKKEKLKVKVKVKEDMRSTAMLMFIYP